MPARDLVFNYLASQVLGPVDGELELVGDPPYTRYLLGTLYPIQASIDELREEEEEDGPSVATPDEGVIDDPVQYAHEWMPSSVGLTFYFEGEPIVSCEVWGARYDTESAGRGRRWRREPLSDEKAPEKALLRFAGQPGRRASKTVMSGRAQLQALFRSMGSGWLVTVTLQNTQSQDEDKRLDPELCLHQVGFRCTPAQGKILEYPSLTLLSDDLEEQELRLLYRGARVYAVGHGCAAEWIEDGPGRIVSVMTNYMPKFEVKPLTYATSAPQDVLLIRRLADDAIPIATIARELEGFLGSYEAWIADLGSTNNAIPNHLKPARDRLLSRLAESVTSMRKGIELLASDAIVARAFRLANRAMLMQMYHSGPDFAGTRRSRGDLSSIPDYETAQFRWRPFQLAFQLLTLPSVASEEDPHREVVDLIWFPTGGGKTEAYLCIAAFEILLRRLRWKDAGGGTAVLTRYTLRLLTAQQFQRAATLICACESLRRERPKEFGRSPITLGLWVGQAVVPNTFADAVKKLDELLASPEPQNSFQLEQCPWCGTEIVPRQRTEDRAAYGLEASGTSFTIRCPSAACVFRECLPIGVIDEDLYVTPPTLLIATVDKFARMAWEERAGAFFGGNGTRPPSLIIQDELHLLTGPLGTTMGVYEAAVEGLIRMRGGNPKIIASTATIRRAGAQTLGLFERGVRVFPASGLRAGESYFAREDTQAPGRLYVGVMSQSHTMAKTMVDIGAALLQAPVELQLKGLERDAYWTLVAYHNSLRELGRTVTQANDDMRARVTTIATDQSKVRQFGDDDIVELTSNVGGDRLPALLSKLARTCDDRESISFLATTSMLSVGVDVPRLGLMVVNGQPKMTAEYIQATSRVGRTSKAPGLVVTLFSATKPRDRSHYEGFIGYHQALYRHVEPTSVTPYALPSRERALHAALVILVRHGLGLSANDAAGRIEDVLDGVSEVVDVLVKRIERIDSRESAAARLQLERKVGHWRDLARTASGLGKKLYYSTRTKQHSELLKDFGAPGEAWPTLHSMRNVDRECAINVYGES